MRKDEQHKKDFFKSFQEAEKTLKKFEIEGARQEVFIPSINDLRYACFHVVEALNPKSHIEPSESWKRARRHCERAKYDCVVAFVAFRLKELKELRERFISVDVVKYMGTENHQKYCEAVVKAEEFLERDKKQIRGNVKYKESSSDLTPQEVQAHIDTWNRYTEEAGSIHTDLKSGIDSYFKFQSNFVADYRKQKLIDLGILATILGTVGGAMFSAVNWILSHWDKIKVFFHLT